MTSTPLATPAPEEALPDEGLVRELWRVVQRRRRVILVAAAAVLVIGALRSFLTRPVYVGTARILIERENPKVLTFKEVTEVDSGRDDYFQTQFKLLQSRSLARRVIEAENLLQEPEFGGPRDPGAVKALLAKPGESADLEGVIDAFLGRLSVQPDKNSRLVNVSFTSHAPALAARVANAQTRLYIEQTLEFRYQTSSDAARWLETQIREQRHRFEEIEQGLQKLKEQDGIVNIEERRLLLEQKLKDLGTSANQLKTARLQKEVLFREMQGSADSEDLPAVMSSPVVQSLRIELASLGRKEAQLAERFLDQHPELVQVRRQIAETRARLRSEAEHIVQAAANDYRTSAAQESSVLAALESTKAEALDLARRSFQYDSQKRELEAAKTVLDSLLARAKETDVTQELRASNIRVVDPAVVPRSPDRPRPKRDLTLALLLGLGLGFGLAFLLDNLDNTLKTPDDVRAHVRAPFLGIIPEAENATRLPALALVHGEGHGAFVEGYRLLRTALTYSWPEQASHALLVTSAMPGEGKTLTSVNLSLTLASADQRVVVVDCDLRRSGVHVALELTRSPGLSDVLVGKCATAEVVQHLTNSRVDVIPAGTPAPSPGDLLTGPAMKRLVDELKAKYAWVVLDSPPVGAVADPLILAPLTDGVLVVAGAEMAARSAVREAVQQVTGTGARVLGVLLNRAHLERRGYYGAYHRVRGNYQRAGA